MSPLEEMSTEYPAQSPDSPSMAFPICIQLEVMLLLLLPLWTFVSFLGSPTKLWMVSPLQSKTRNCPAESLSPSSAVFTAGTRGAPTTNRVPSARRAKEFPKRSPRKCPRSTFPRGSHDGGVTVGYADGSDEDEGLRLVGVVMVVKREEEEPSPLPPPIAIALDASSSVPKPTMDCSSSVGRDDGDPDAAPSSNLPSSLSLVLLLPSSPRNNAPTTIPIPTAIVNANANPKMA
mmetsp:Transcript_2490/g.5386  ORF Transcript_2490/g.5386 Transcript_2490/m.5386 type:complete len:233 (-) Transcript_2490:76-774(-)